jgi:hypothetical protein
MGLSDFTLGGLRRQAEVNGANPVIFGPRRIAFVSRQSSCAELLESRTLLSVTLNQPISNVSFAQDSGPETVDLYALFADSTGAADLQFTATSSATAVATTSILGNTLTLKPTAGRSGFTIVKLTATDPTGGTATNAFRVQITALAARSLDVTLDAKHRSVTFVQTDHALATISLSGPGTAVVHFGGDGLKLNGSVLQGSHTEMESVTLSNTTGKSHLTIVGAPSGSGQAIIGNITVNNSLGTLDVHKAVLLGDVQSTHDLQNLNCDLAENGSITIGSGSTRLSVGTAEDENFQSSGGVSFLKNTQWLNSDDVPESFIAAALHGMDVRGNFMPDLEVTGAGVKGRSFDHVKIRGNVAGSWFVQGKTGTIILGSIQPGWQGQFQQIASITASGTFNGALSAESLGLLKIRGALFFSTINLTGANTTDLGSLIAGSIDGLILKTTGSIGAISSADIFNTTIFAGVGNVPSGDVEPAAASDFSANARIGSIRVHPGTKLTGFSASQIAAARLGTLELVTTNTQNEGFKYGIAAESIDNLSAHDKTTGQDISLHKIASATALASEISKHHWKLNNFELRVV